MDVSLRSRPSALRRFGQWLAEMLIHAFGDPRQESAHQPPAVGVQPYSGRTRRRSDPRHD